MTGKIRGANPAAGGLKINKVVRVYWSEKFQRYISASWPQGHGPDSVRRAAARAAFIASTQLLKLAGAAEYDSADDWAKNSPYLRRDLLMAGSSGTLWTALAKDGTYYGSWYMSTSTLTQQLDGICDTPGAMLVRTADTWVALLPGEANDVLTFDEAAQAPYWAAPSGGGGGGDYVWGTAGYYTDIEATAGFCAAIKPALPISITSVQQSLTTVNGATYRIAIAEYDLGTSALLTDPEVLYEVTIGAASGQANDLLYHKLDTPYLLTSGVVYLMMFYRTDGGNTPIQTVACIPASTLVPAYGFYPQTHDSKLWGTLLSHPAPVAGTTTTGTSTRCYGPQFTYSI